VLTPDAAASNETPLAEVSGGAIRYGIPDVLQNGVGWRAGAGWRSCWASPFGSAAMRGVSWRAALLVVTSLYL